MKTRLDELVEQRRTLQTQVVQLQAMLYLTDYYISEEMLEEVDLNDTAEKDTLH